MIKVKNKEKEKSQPRNSPVNMCTGDVVDGGGGVVVLRSKGFPSCGTTSHCTCSTNGFAESSRGWIFGATDDGNVRTS